MIDDEEGLKNQSDGGKGFLPRLRKLLLPVLTVFSVVCAVVFGLILRLNSNTKWTQREVMYIQFPGDLFLRMLKAMVIPLMVSSVTSAIGSLDLNVSKKIGFRAITYYLATTIIAVIEGVILVLLIHPGKPSITEEGRPPPKARVFTTVDTLLDLIRNIFPPNLIQAATEQYRTLLDPPETPINSTVNWTVPDIKEWKISGEYVEDPNVLGLILFSVVHGIAIGKLGDLGKSLLHFYKSLEASIMLITNWIIWLSPVGVFSLVVAQVLQAESFAALVGQLGLYFLTVLLGVGIHGLIVLPGIYALCCHTLPFRFMANMSQAVLTAFATCSSTATLSVSLQCLEEKNNVDTRVTRFVMPIGATVNMDGLALYEAVAVIFISQVRQMSLSLGQVVAISLSATLASIGTAAIPQSGLVTIVMVLGTVGLPAEDVSLIFAVDWLLERFRTALNVMGDAIGAGVVEHLSKDDLENLPKSNSNQNSDCKVI